MLNQVVLVGRVIDLDLYDYTIKIEVQRSTPENGEYLKDKVTITLLEGMMNNVHEYCQIGDLIGIKGHIRESYYNVAIIAEKITFLSSKKDNHSDDIDNEEGGE